MSTLVDTREVHQELPSMKYVTMAPALVLYPHSSDDVWVNIQRLKELRCHADLGQHILGVVSLWVNIGECVCAGPSTCATDAKGQ